MTVRSCPSFAQWYSEGRLATYVRARKSVGGILSLLELQRPAGVATGPAMPDLVLSQDILGGSRVVGDLGSGRFDVKSEKGSLYLAAPDFACTNEVDSRHQVRSLALPVAQWQSILEQASDGQFSFDVLGINCRMFHSTIIRSAFQKLWSLCDDEGAPSRLLSQAAGCEILAELCRLSGTPFAPVKGGLAPWAERRCMELMQARLSEDISLNELAAEVRLSSFHFARMFKQSLGVPPRVYLTRLRVEKACELLEHTDLPITEIALEVGYSSNQVLARVFLKHMRLSPTDYRRAVRDPVRSIALQ